MTKINTSVKDSYKSLTYPSEFVIDEVYYKTILKLYFDFFLRKIDFFISLQGNLRDWLDNVTSARLAVVL